MTYTCAKLHFFKYSLSLYTLSVFLSPITQLLRSLFSGSLHRSSLCFLLSPIFQLPRFLFSGFLHRYSLDLPWFSLISPGYYLFFLGFSYQSFVLFMFLMIFFFSGFPAVLSYFSRLLFLLFGFFLSNFRSFHVSDDFFSYLGGFLHGSSMGFLFSYFSMLLFFLFGFSYQSFVFFHVSDIFFFFGFPAVLSYFFRLLFILFGFFLSKFRSFHVSAVFSSTFHFSFFRNQ